MRGVPERNVPSLLGSILWRAACAIVVMAVGR
jgi:hypothetical protein